MGERGKLLGVWTRLYLIPCEVQAYFYDFVWLQLNSRCQSLGSPAGSEWGGTGPVEGKRWLWQALPAVRAPLTVPVGSAWTLSSSDIPRFGS